jgi:hypothetical protein
MAASRFDGQLAWQTGFCWKYFAEWRHPDGQRGVTDETDKTLWTMPGC